MTDGAALAARAPHVAESVERGPPRLRFRQAARHQLALPHREMEVELRVNFVVNGGAAEAERKSLPEIH